MQLQESINLEMHSWWASASRIECISRATAIAARFYFCTTTSRWGHLENGRGSMSLLATTAKRTPYYTKKISSARWLYHYLDFGRNACSIKNWLAKTFFSFGNEEEAENHAFLSVSILIFVESIFWIYKIGWNVLAYIWSVGSCLAVYVIIGSVYLCSKSKITYWN